MSYIPYKVIPQTTEPERWVIELNRYQRDNLLWLLLAVWGCGVPPFDRAATGDWVGEIPWMLRLPGQESPQLTPDDHPLCSVDELRRRVQDWLDGKIKQATDGHPETI